MYWSELIVARTSERVCPIQDNISGRILYLKIVIECNIFIIVDIYINSATSVTLRFSFIFVRVRHPVSLKCVRKNIFADYLSVQNIAGAIDALPGAKCVSMRQYNTQTYSLGGWE